MLPNLLQLYSRLLRLSVGNEIPWSELADAQDLYTVVEHGKYQGWARVSEVYGKPFVLLHQRERDKALEHVHSWTTKDINIQGLPPRPGN